MKKFRYPKKMFPRPYLSKKVILKTKLLFFKRTYSRGVRRTLSNIYNGPYYKNIYNREPHGYLSSQCALKPFFLQIFYQSAFHGLKVFNLVCVEKDRCQRKLLAYLIFTLQCFLKKVIKL